jgi:transposase-like protein
LRTLLLSSGFGRRCCDGLRGLPEAITATWPQASVQTGVVHLVRNTLRYAPKKHWQAITRQLKVVYTAVSVDAAVEAFEEFATEWQPRYPAMIAMWRRSWDEFTPFLAFPVEIRKIIYTTNRIESLNARCPAGRRSLQDIAPRHAGAEAQTVVEPRRLHRQSRISSCTYAEPASRAKFASASCTSSAISAGRSDVLTRNAAMPSRCASIASSAMDAVMR